ncbi:MAG: hypothetical protein QOD86_1680 [Miltoncostaeaceae bacterium]|jgi:hypothetical protein|nr:hypothetical protein [Miltoncostaeaceae bacterium]
MHGDPPPVRMTSPPLFTVRRGATVRFRFGAAPTGAVLLDVRHGGRLDSRARYRLSPFETSWRARGRGGVLELQVSFRRW